MARNRFDCVAIGDVMFDVYVGNLANPIHFLKGGTSYCDFAKIDFGGAGNVASALSLLGGRICFLGKAGDDPLGKLYQRDLSSKGVSTHIFFEKRTPTGIALVTIGRKERSFYVFRGANARLTKAEIDTSIVLLKKTDYLYFSGYSLISNPQRDAVLHAVGLAKEYGVRVVFDPGAFNIVKSNFKLFDHLLDLCDVFSPNIKEAKAITETKRIEEAISKLQKRQALTALKCGPRGCVLIEKNKSIRVPPYEIECSDTTGAGDAFVAALIFGLCKQFPLKAVGQLANWFAAQTVKYIGSRNFPPKVRIINFMEKLNH